MAAYPAATLLPNTAYTAGEILRYTWCLALCTASGTTGASLTALTPNSFYPEDAVTLGTSTWRILNGRSGYVPNSWDTASPYLSYLASPGSVGYARNKYGFMHDASGYGATVYCSHVMTIPANDVRMWTLNNQQVNVPTILQGGAPQQVAILIYPALPVVISSADETVPTVSTPTYAKGFTILFDNINETFGEGYIEWRGVVFDIVGSEVATGFTHDPDPVPRSNTRNIAANTFIDCTFRITAGTGALPYPMVLFGARPSAASEGYYEYRLNSGIVDDVVMVDTVLLYDTPNAMYAFAIDCTMQRCTFSTTGGEPFPLSGVLSVGDGGASTRAYNPSRVWAYSLIGREEGRGDRVITLTACTFDRDITYLLHEYPCGKTVVNMIGCSFTSSNFTTWLDNVPAGILAAVDVHFYGCGVPGAVDPESHVHVTPRLRAIKTNNVYRAGTVPGLDGALSSYYVATRAKGLHPYTRSDPLTPYTAAMLRGVYMCSLYICVPPGQLLHNDEFFMYCVGPDTTGRRSDLPGISYSYITEGPGRFTEPVTVTATTRRDSLLHDRVQYPVVADSWVGTPGGWVVQEVSVILNCVNDGKIHCTPFVSASSIEFILCGNLVLRKLEHG